MRIARFEYEGTVYEGTVDQDSVETEDHTFRIGEVSFLPPCQPSKIIGVGANYREVVEHFENDIPDAPHLFFKPPSSVVAPDEVIPYPPVTDHLIFEGELALVMKDECYRVDESNALDYVAGYTCANDMTAMDLYELENRSPLPRTKGLDGSCPLGPFIEQSIPGAIDVTTKVNGEQKQSADTSELVFSFDEMVSEISQYMTLYPEDVILTGTPIGFDKLIPGDTVEINVGTAGTLKNTLV